MPPIRLLPEQPINQIAAGEVIERPASALKELVENAIDAGASRVDITLEEGGLAGLRVSDNGCGMSDVIWLWRLPAMPPPNWQMMIRWLFYILDFAAKPLPSIASVAVLAMTSRIKGAEHGWQLAVSHGKPGEIQPAASDIGTQIEISDLFGSIPARLKFLKPEKQKPHKCLDVVSSWRWPVRLLAFICAIRAKICLALPRSQIMKQAGKPVWPH